MATLSEQGLAGFDVSTWYGLIAPAQTPPAIVNLLASKVRDFLQSPDVQRQMLEQGLEVVGNTPAEFETQIRGEVAKWSQVKLRK
ncbi:Tripartite tricarboxylate transporter family receptor [compost metagenome]